MRALRARTRYQVPLAKVKTKKRPFFATLSYAWGDPRRTHNIRCGNEATGITQSLYDALVYIRHLRIPRLLWVDSLCINQDDDEEKSQQVQRMSLIYGQSHCISWLGVESETQDDMQAMLPILKWFNQAARTFRNKRRWISWEGAKRYHAQNSIPGHSSLLDIPWAALHQCLDRDIFKRLWCVQETILPRSNDIRTSRCHVDIGVLAGSCHFIHIILSDYLSNWGSDLTVNNWSLELLRGRCSDDDLTLRGLSWEGSPFPCIKFKRQTDSQFASAADTATTIYWKECTDPRDRIYGLAALSELGATYRISYSKTSLAVHEVFTDFTLYCLKTTKSLSLFQEHYRIAVVRDRGHVTPFTQHREWTSGLPSWCPDFAGPRPHLRDMRHGLRSSPLKACRGRPARFTTMSRRCVGVVGYFLGTVQNCSIMWAPMEHGHSETTTIERQRSRANSFQRCASTIGSVVNANHLGKLFLNVCAAGGDLKRSSAWSRIEPLFPAKTRDRMVQSTIGAAWIMEYAPDLAPRDGLLLSRKLSPDDWRRAAQSLDTWLHLQSYGTRLFTTDNANAILGTGPDGLRVGDVVCVLFGSHLPFILRQVGNKGEYKLIGDCYVEGIMHGEALDMGLEEREFLLI